MWGKNKHKIENNKKEKDGETIRESSNQFTPFRRVVFDWQFKEKAENFCIGWGGAGQSGQGLRNNPGVGASENQQFILCSESGRFLGSVVPRGAAGSLLRWGEVLCLAEFTTHTRHKGVAQVNTETLQRQETEEWGHVTRPFKQNPYTHFLPTTLKVCPCFVCPKNRNNPKKRKKPFKSTRSVLSPLAGYTVFVNVCPNTVLSTRLAIFGNEWCLNVCKGT